VRWHNSAREMGECNGMVRCVRQHEGGGGGKTESRVGNRREWDSETVVKIIKVLGWQAGWRTV
jgi:hypothetical protein